MFFVFFSPNFFFLDGDDGEPRGTFCRTICRAGKSKSRKCRAGPSASEQKSHAQQPGPVQCRQEEPAHARNGCHGRGQILSKKMFCVRCKNCGSFIQLGILNDSFIHYLLSPASPLFIAFNSPLLFSLTYLPISYCKFKHHHLLLFHFLLPLPSQLSLLVSYSPYLPITFLTHVISFFYSVKPLLSGFPAVAIQSWWSLWWPCWGHPRNGAQQSGRSGGSWYPTFCSIYCSRCTTHS